MRRIIIAVVFLSIFGPRVFADNFVPKNLLISTGNQIYEYTYQGGYVRNIATVYPGGYSVTERARDIAMDAEGDVHVYNGTFYPYMSTYMTESASWNHMTYEGFSTVNNGSYGGIAVYDQTVFATDMSTASGGEAQGVVAFDMATGQAQRFAENVQPIDLTIGLDGFLYLLSPGGSPGGRTIHVYDPANLSLLDTIDLTAIFGWTEHRAIAVDENGDIFIADWDGEIHHITSDGDIVATISPSCNWSGSPTNCQFTDINIAADDGIALGTRFGEILVTNTGFSDVFTFSVGMALTFVEFANSALILDSVPTIVIDSPLDGETYTEDEVIVLAALASDEEDGDIGSSVQWFSSLQGAIGTGATMDILLIPGQHTITASVTDSHLQSASAEVIISVTPSVTPEYCTAAGINTYYEYIDGVTIGMNVFESGNNNGYFDHSGVPPAILTKGETITIGLTPGFPYGSYVEHWQIWIDLDQNANFEAEELLYGGSAITDINTAITIPAAASTGLTRMRVTMKYGGPAAACGNFPYGEVEDILVVIEE